MPSLVWTRLDQLQSDYGTAVAPRYLASDLQHVQVLQPALTHALQPLGVCYMARFARQFHASDLTCNVDADRGSVLLFPIRPAVALS